MSQHCSPSTLSPFTAADGENLALHEWPVSANTPLRGLVVLVHGLGEHAGRYGALAEQLNAWGFAVRGYDHYGHGASAGPRGGLTSDTRLLDDLADMIECTRARLPPGLPLVLLGHSMGGLVAARLVSLNLCPVDALVLSSPALDAGLGPVQKLLVSTLPRIAPNLRVGNGLDAHYLSHDAQVVANYRADPQCHDRISARLARFIADAGPATVATAPTWAVPTLLMWAGADRLVNPAGSRAFAQAAPPAMVQSHCFEGAFHELFNETPEYATPVLQMLQDWLLARFGVKY
ncbi:MAG: lysophospholipase [Acidovorax sp.]|nr:lysophospholipase [Acidovorax sp.]